MGITGLLPLLKKASKNCHVRRFSGCTVAIDAFGWLHKGAFGCAAQLGKGEPTTAYVTYCLKYINVLVSNGVKPILVFDGKSLPAKAVTDNKRREKRQENKKRAQQCLRDGNKKEAWECFTRCVEITPAMTRELIKVLQQQHIDYIISPYEADAQMAYLSLNGIVDIIITEDSDLVLFGCSKIFFKMNVNGDGVLFDSSKLPACMGIPPNKFSLEHLRRMCILSGCDYLPSLPGIGLVKAKKVFMPPSTRDIRTVLNSVPQIVQLNITIPEEYILAFVRADNTFLYQLAFDPLTRTVVPLNPYPSDLNVKELTYAGTYFDKSLALDMALANVDVKTEERIDYFDPSNPKSGYKNTSIWCKNYKRSQNSALLLENYDKKETKHHHSNGLKVSLAVKASLKKRQIDCLNEDENEEDILSLYYNKSEKGDDNTDEVTVKKFRLQEIEGDGDEKAGTDINYAGWGERVLRSSTRVNPFIKSPEKIIRTMVTMSNGNTINTKIASSPSKCKKEVKENENVVVKSKYFRSTDKFESPTKTPIDEEVVLSPSIMTKPWTRRSRSRNSRSLESPVKSKIENDIILSPSVITRSFYRKSESKEPELSKEPQVTQEDPVQSSATDKDCVHGEEDEILYLESKSSTSSYFKNSVNVNGCNFDKTPVVSLTQLTQKFGNLKSATPKGLPRKPSSTSCRRLGISKNTKLATNKRDSNQKNLRDMFSAQPKPKI